MKTPDDSPPTPPNEPRGVSTWWRVSTIICLLALSVAVATLFSMLAQFEAQVRHLQTQLKDTAQLKYLAVLNDAQQQPSMLITMNLQDNTLQLQRLNAVVEGREQSLQLWALSEGDPVRSLGVLASKGKTLRLPATERDWASATHLGISVETKGGVPSSRGPSLPFLFTGSVIQKAL
jgi:anti-sigma-K factor RskA